MQLWFQELFVSWVWLDMRLDNLLVILVDVVFINFDEVESNIVCICINGICQEFWNKRRCRLLHVLQGQSESSLKDKNLDNLLRNNELLMSYKEIKHLLMREDNLWVRLWHICSFVFNHNWNKIKDSYSSVLVFVHLLIFNSDQLIANILGNMKFALCLNQMVNHICLLFSQNDK